MPTLRNPPERGQMGLFDWRPPAVTPVHATPPGARMPDVDGKIFDGSRLTREHLARMLDRAAPLGVLPEPPWPTALPIDAEGRPFAWPAVVDEPFLRDLVRRGALVLVSSSGGKDSQAMLVLLARIVPRQQMLVVHANLPEVEWGGTADAARQQAEAVGARFLQVEGIRTFFDMVDERKAKNVAKHRADPSRPEAPSWPSAEYRLCTSTLKTQPIEKAVTHWATAHGFRLIVGAMGVRGEESPRREKLPAWRLNEGPTLDPFRPGRRASSGDRIWINYLPIHHIDVGTVMSVIHAAGQRVHPAYYAGNERLSCVFCIMASSGDLRRGAQHYPELYERMIEKEAETGFTMHQSRKPLQQIVGMTPAEAKAQRRSLPVVTGPLPTPPRSGGKRAAAPGGAATSCADEWADWGRK